MSKGHSPNEGKNNNNGPNDNLKKFMEENRKNPPENWSVRASYEVQRQKKDQQKSNA